MHRLRNGRAGEKAGYAGEFILASPQFRQASLALSRDQGTDGCWIAFAERADEGVNNSLRCAE